MSVPPWLQAPLKRLDAIMERLPHGLLIQGPGGWGEVAIADALVERLLHLDAARPAREVAHPDLRWLEPESGIIKVDQVRATIDFLLQTPRFARCKVAVIVDADRMNLNAANALLKSLEEPPAESFLVLVSGAPERLLPTVRSRCQRLEVQRVDHEAVMTWLAETGVEGDLARHMAIEHGDAPFAIRDAVARGEEPLWPLLVRAGQTPRDALDAADSRKDDNLADLAGRWLRIVHWLARQRLDQPGAVLEFAAELQKLREVALFNTGLNRTMQLQRLFLMWVDLWRDAGPSLAAR